MKAIRIQQNGGPEVLQQDEIPLPEPGPGEARVRLQAAGVNYIDTYHRAGAYDQSLPFTPGVEGAGTVDAVGSDVADIHPGDRVAYAMQLGSYAQYAAVPAWRLVKLPDQLSTDLAAAAMLQGMTAHYLLHDVFAVQEGHTVLIHAAAGGMGLLLVQIAKLRGARVIGTTSTEEKAQIARDHGADENILYTETDFVEAVQELTGGQGVDVVYDGVGKDTFLKGLDCLRPRGMMALYGQASGAVEPLDPQVLNRKGSLFLTRPSLSAYAADPSEIEERAGAILVWIASGALQIHIDRRLPLSEAGYAHKLLEGRQTTGKLLLIPPEAEQQEDPQETLNTADPVDESSWESFPASDPPAY